MGQKAASILQKQEQAFPFGWCLADESLLYPPCSMEGKMIGQINVVIRPVNFLL